MTAEEATAIARHHAEHNGWAWIEPARAQRRTPWFRSKGARWMVFSHVTGLGPKVRVVIDEDSRAVIDSGYVLR